MKIFNGVSPKIFKISIFFILGIILTLGLSISFQSILAAYTAPLANPATCVSGNPGCDAPLNIGAFLQYKTGPLWINTSGVSPLGLIVEKGSVGIGTMNPAAYGGTTKLAVAGVIQSVGVPSSNSIQSYNTNDGTAIAIQSNAGTGVIGGNKPLLFWANNANIMKISASNGLAFGNTYYATDPGVNNVIIQGNVGIGTTNPGAYRLNVNGNTNITGTLNVTGTITGSLASAVTISAGNVFNGTFGSNTGGGNYSFTGNVGIGDTTPEAKLKIVDAGTTSHGLLITGSQTSGNTGYFYTNSSQSGSTMRILMDGAGSTGTALSVRNDGTGPIMELFDGNDSTSRFIVKDGGNVGIGTTNPVAKVHVLQATNNVWTGAIVSTAATGLNYGLTVTAGTNASDIAFRVESKTSAPLLHVLGSGNVGIGTTNPTYNLQVTGTGYFSGNLTIGGSLNVSGADVAEEFATTEDLEMGTVVIMADEGIKTAKPSEIKYDKKVIGVVSNNPSVIMGKIPDKIKAVIALVGVVKVKVTAQNGEIKKGDLLVTSDLRGHAMKATEEKAGTIIGKALENFSGQTGEITALINLQ